MAIKRVETDKISSFFVVIVLSLLLAILTNFTLQYSQMLRNLTETIQWIRANTINFTIGSCLIFLIYIIMGSVIGNFKISSTVCFIFFAVVAFANMKKLSILGEPLYPVDFYQIRLIKPLIEMIGGNIIEVLLVSVTLITVIVKLLSEMPKITVKFPARFAMLLISCILVYCYVNYNNTFVKSCFSLAGIEKVDWDQRGNYDDNGFVVGTLFNLQTIVMNKPDNYNEETVRKIAEKYKVQAEDINKTRVTNEGATKPNIVFIMSEAFWDPTRLPNVKFMEDPLSNFRQTMAKNSSGWMLSPVFGGNTANTEFEALTGFSMYNLLPGTIPYQEAMDKKKMIPSIVSTLEDEKYDTLAIHPYKKIFYKRDIVYNTLGFNNFIGETEMKYQNPLPDTHLISDQSVTDEILYQLSKSDNPTFMHVVTIQNHFPYDSVKYKNKDASFEGLTGEDAAELEAYTQGIRESDKAMKNLFDGLDKLKKPTIVVFFGDHLPSLKESIYNQGGFLSEESLEGKREYSETPLLIYSNFDLPKKNLNTVSPAYLGVTLFDMLNKPLTPYYAMLEDVKAKLPGLKTGVLIDSQGKPKSELTKEDQELLSDYELIQYDLLAGNQYSMPILFNK